MKKKSLYCSIFLIASMSAFAEMEVERGYGNVEISTSYYHFADREEFVSPYKEIHDFVDVQNDFLYKQSSLDWEKENIWRGYIAGGSGKKYENIGGGLLFYHAYDEGAFVGVHVEGRNITFKYDEKDLKGSRGSIRFLFDKQEENGTRLFISPYYLFDNIKNIQNKGVGIYAKQEIAVDLAKYALPEEGVKVFAEIDAHRNEVKKQKNFEKHRNKNDSVQAGLGLTYETAIELDEVVITPSIAFGYKREFLEDRKYRSIQEKENNLDIVKASVGVDMKYKNIEIDIENIFFKSTNTRNHENRLSATFTYKF